MSASAGTAYVAIKPDFSSMNRELAAKMAPLANQFGSRFGKALGPVMAQQSKHLRTFATAAKYGAVGGAALAVVVGKDLVQAGMKFEKQISINTAVAEADRKQQALLEKQSIKLGKATFFSATQAAEAQGELVKGGLSVQQILTGGLDSALSLAEAGELELATSAETTVNAMKLFDIQGKESMTVADGLSTAANKTTADVEDFAMAFNQGGGAVKAAGGNFNDALTILEAMAEAGYKNSDAGTSMKTALVQLAAPTKKQAALTKELGLHFFDQNGNLKSAVGLSKELQRALKGREGQERLNIVKTLAGTDGFRTLLSLWEAGPQKLRSLEIANERQGTAQDLAKKKMDNLAGSFEQFKGSVETAEIAIYKGMAPALREMADEATEAANKVGAIFEDPKLSGSQKIEESLELVSDELGRFWEENELTEHLVDLLDKAVPAIAEHAGKLGFEATKAFIHGFTHADLIGKAVMATWLVHFIGGKAPFIAIGKSLGQKLGLSLGQEAAKTAAPIIATETAVASAAAMSSPAVIAAQSRTVKAAEAQSRRTWLAASPAFAPNLAPAAKGSLAHSMEGFALPGAFGGAGAFPDLEREMAARGTTAGAAMSTGLITRLKASAPEIKTTLAGVGSRAASGIATWGLGGLVVGEMTKEIVGGDVGQEFGDAFQGAGVGAAIGSAIAPGVGTALGAALGGMAGIIAGGLGDDAGDEVGERFLLALRHRLPEIQHELSRFNLGTEGKERVQRWSGPKALEMFREGNAPPGTSFGEHGELAIRRIQTAGSGLRGLRSELRAKREEIDELGGSAQALEAVQQKLTLVNKAIEQGVDAIHTYKGNFDLLRSEQVTRMADISDVTQRSMAIINKVWANNPPKWRQATAEALKASVAAIKTGMDKGVINTDIGTKRIKELMRKIDLFEGNDPLKMADGFAKSWKQAGTVNQAQIDHVVHDLKRMPKGAREAAQDAMVQMARQMEQKGQLVKGSATRLQSALVTTFGQTNRKVVKGVEGMVGDLGHLFGNLDSAVSTALGGLGAKVNSVLKAFGVNKAAISFSLDAGGAAVKAIGKAAQGVAGAFDGKQQGGFVVPGQGSGDQFKTFVPAGSFVLNREATMALGRQFGGMVPVELEPKEHVFYPESVRSIGQANLERWNSEIPRFQRGGKVGEPQISGPDPLRSLGQAAIHKATAAANAYVDKHRPHGLGAIGVGGSVADHPELQPAISAIVATILKKFPGLAISSTTGGGHAEGSYHYSGRAADLAAGSDYMLKAAAWIKANLGAELTEGIHNPNLSVKYGKEVSPGFWESSVWADHVDHIHVAKQMGGLVQKMLSGGKVEAWDELTGSHWDNDELATLAHIVGMRSPGSMAQKAQGESSGNRKAVGHDAGGTEGLGLWQITTGFNDDKIAKYGGRNSMFHPYFNAEAAKEVVEEGGPFYAPPTGPLGRVQPKLAEQMRAVAGGKDPNSDEHTFKEDIPAEYLGCKTGSIDFPSTPKSKQGIEKEIGQRQREIRKYSSAAQKAKKANKPAIQQALQHNITALHNRIAELSRALQKARFEAAQKAFSKRLSRYGAAKISGYETRIQGVQRQYNEASQYAEQVVDLEPIMPEAPALKEDATDAERETAEKAQRAVEKDWVGRFSGYIQGPETAAFQSVLETEANWRNTILRAESWGFSAKEPSVQYMERDWEQKIRQTNRAIDEINRYTEKVAKDEKDWRQDHPNAKDLPKWLKAEVDRRDAERARLPMLRFEDREYRKALGEGREEFFGGGDRDKLITPPALPLDGSGALEDQLADVQGVHWPDHHELLKSLPGNRVAGMLGGAIWETEGAIQELGLKISQAANGLDTGSTASKPDESERQALLEEIVRQDNQEKIVREIERKAFGEQGIYRRQLGGLIDPRALPKYHDGGVIRPTAPGVREVPVMAQPGERIRTPEQEAALARSIRGATGPSHQVTVNVHDNGDVDVEIDDRKIEAVVNRMGQRGSRSAGRRRAVVPR